MGAVRGRKGIVHVEIAKAGETRGEESAQTTVCQFLDTLAREWQATRSVDECLRLAEADMVIRTSLLEHRLVCGDAVLAQSLRERLLRTLEALLRQFPPQPDAAIVAERLQRMLEAAMRAKGWAVTASIGAVSFHNAPESVDAALSLADSLMYGAKAAGRNRVLHRDH